MTVPVSGGVVPEREARLRRITKSARKAAARYGDGMTWWPYAWGRRYASDVPWLLSELAAVEARARKFEGLLKLANTTSKRRGERVVELQEALREQVEGREGMVTVYDHEGRYVGCMGIETWQDALASGDGTEAADK
jgi:hypothetical protein